MTPERHSQVAALFDRLRMLPAADRALALDRDCVEDDALRQEVEELLDFSERDTPVPAGSALEQGLRILADEALTDEKPDSVPSQIGPYEPIRQIGKGGTGVVYEAYQKNPRRSVAVKVMHSTYTSANVVRQLRREAHALGRLQHPGIANVIEAGVAGQGGISQPFVAMELVLGQPLTSFVRERALDDRSRLELVAHVCDAVEHAHQRGIIHRDLKPANILVTEDGQPKILDFGLAKLTDADMTLFSIESSADCIAGTLPYMSPEQIGGDSSHVDARADIYALGVILYELLAGALPFDVRAKPLAEAARLIAVEEPSRLGSLNSRFRGDLETIVAKALSKERNRRYATAAELAADIRRYLRDEPITARPPSTFYQLWKFSKRNKGLASGVAIAFVGLSVGLVMAVQMAIEARSQAENLRRQRYRYLISMAQQSLKLHNTGNAMNLLGQADEDLRALEWYYLNRVLDQSDANWNPTDRAVLAIAAHPQKEIVAFGDATGTIGFLEARTGRKSVLPRRGGARVECLAYSTDGSLLASGGADRSVVIWNMDADPPTNRELPHTSEVTAAAFNPDGRRLASAAKSGILRIWDIDTGDAIWEWLGHSQPILDLAWSPNGASMASCSVDGTVKVWDISTRKKTGDYTAHTGAVCSVAFSDDGKFIYSGGSDGVICVKPLDGSQPRRHLLGHTGEITWIAALPGGGIASSAADRTVRIWDRRTGQFTAVLHGHEDQILDGALLNNGTRIVTAGKDHTIRMWQPPFGQAHVDLTGHYQDVLDVAVSQDERFVASAGSDDVIRLWDAKTTDELCHIQTAHDDISSLAFSPTSDRVVSGGSDGCVILWDALSGGRLKTFHLGGDPIRDIAFKPNDADLFAAASADGSVRLVRVETGDTTQVAVDAEALNCLSFDRRGEMLAVGTPSGRVALVDSDGKNVFRSGPEHTGGTTAVIFDPSGQTLYSGGSDSKIRVWARAHFETGSQRVFASHNGVIRGLAMTPNGNRLISCGMDGSVRFWDTASGDEVFSFAHPGFDCHCMAFNPRNEQLYVGITGQYPLRSFVRLWEAHDVSETIKERRWTVLRARQLIDRSSEKNASVREIRAEIEASRSCPNEVRVKAFEILALRGENPQGLAFLAWRAVQDRVDDPKACRLALQRAEIAADLTHGKDIAILHTLGVAQYRAAHLGLASFEEAQRTLETTTSARGEPQDLAFLCMTLANLYEFDRAQELLSEIEYDLQNDARLHVPHLYAFLQEAREEMQKLNTQNKLLPK